MLGITNIHDKKDDEARQHQDENLKQRPFYPNNGCEQMSAFEGVDCDKTCIFVVVFAVELLLQLFVVSI